MPAKAVCVLQGDVSGTVFFDQKVPNWFFFCSSYGKALDIYNALEKCFVRLKEA